MRALVAAMLVAACASADGGATPDASCVAILDGLRAQVETIYAGYRIEVAANPERQNRYAAAVERARERAMRARDRHACTRALRAYIAHFDDPHLFLVDAPIFTAAAREHLRQIAPNAKLSAEAARRRALADADADALAGIWATATGDVAIARVDQGYEAVVVESLDEAWPPGTLVATMERAGAGYDFTLLRESDRAPILYQDAHIERGVLLHFAPTTWGKLAPLPPDARGYDPRAPRAPGFIDYSPAAAIIVAPSFDPGVAGRPLGALIEQNLDTILSKQLLVIDVRGNEGGSSWVWRQLAPLYVGTEWEPPDRTRSGRDVVYSSAPTIAYFERQRETAEGEYQAFLTSLLDRLNAAPGELITYDASADSEAASQPFTPSTIHPTPPHIAVLTDSDVVSAGEAFLLHASRSPRVTLFGEPSAGSIDYWSVNVIEIRAGVQRYLLGYPVGATSANLPAGGYNRTGVPVDVRLARPQERWLDAVLAHYGVD